MTVVESLTDAEARFQACATKTCCERREVIVDGLELTRVARTLDLAPWHFSGPRETSPGEHAFLLAGPDRYFESVLLHESTRSACVFLVRLADDTGRCGLGSLKPSACQAEPGPGCPCPTGLHRREDARFRGVVAQWNDLVRANPSDEFTYQDYCRFLLEAYEGA